jgi:acetyltransferase
MPAHNPIDYGGTAEENPLVIAETVKEVMADPDIDLVYLTGFFGGFQDIIAPHVGRLEVEASQRLVRLVEEWAKPLVVHSAYAEDGLAALKVLAEAGVPVVAGSGRAAQRLGALGRQADNRRMLSETRLIEGDGSNREAARKIINSARLYGATNMIETKARQLLAAYGFHLPQAGLAATPEEAVRMGAAMRRPVALKIVSPEIIHKSDIGGVELNLSTPEEIGEAAKRILNRARKFTSADRISGCLVTPMADSGQEIILGLVRHEQFGPVIMFGLGGILVEVLKDVAFGICPLTEPDIGNMITSIKGFPILQGFRGQAPKDIKTVKSMVAKLSIMALENPEIMEIDLNPVIVHEEGATVVDVRVILAE